MSHARLLYARPDGTLLEHPGLLPAALTFHGPQRACTWRPLPHGATMCQLPGCTAQGYDAKGNLRTLSPEIDLAVGALLPTGYARIVLPAYRKPVGAPYLPLFGYTAVASVDGEICASCEPIDAPGTWNPDDYSTPELKALVDARISRDAQGPLIEQLSLCALEYGCYTAQNVFYERWEGALPSSRSCSAQCIGCISEQRGSVPSPQTRLLLQPTPDQMADLALAHLSGGPHRMISFGQGCEGEPLNRWRAVAQAIASVRARLPAAAPNGGCINMNTNGWHTRGLKAVVNSGLQRIRISLISAIDDHYAAYYKPRGYSFDDVRNSIKLCADQGVWVALNLLTFPGYTDCSGEVDALCDLIRTYGVHEVQVRTLNIDREMFVDSMPPPTGAAKGISRLLATLQETGVRVATHAWIGPQPSSGASGGAAHGR